MWNHITARLILHRNPNDSLARRAPIDKKDRREPEQRPRVIRDFYRRQIHTLAALRDSRVEYPAHPRVRIRFPAHLISNSSKH